MIKPEVKTHIIVILLITFVSSIIYLNSLRNDFVFDDIILIKDNKSIRSFESITHNLWRMYRPLRDISYAIDYKFSGLNPLGYHISNILYHTITSILVYLIVRLLNKNVSVSLFASLLFAAHPIHTDAVTYISGRRDILSTLFFLLGFYCFLRHRANKRIVYIILAFLAYLLGVLSKEMAVTLPLIFFAYDFYYHFNTEETRLNIRFFRDICLNAKKVFLLYKYLYIPIVIGSVTFSYYIIFILKVTKTTEWYGGSIILNFLTVSRICVYYLKLLFYPVKLNADYSLDFPVSESLLDTAGIISIAILIGIFYCLLRSLLVARPVKSYMGGHFRRKIHLPFFEAFNGARRSSLVPFCGVWFFVTLLPVSQIIPHHELIAEHYLYLPSFGFCLFIAECGMWSAELLRIPKSAIRIGFIIVMLLYSYRTIERNKDWRDDYTLWKKTCETAPNCARAHNNLGIAYFNKDMIDEAIAEYKKAIELNPAPAEPHINFGAALIKKGSPHRAILECKKAVELNPNIAKAYNVLGAAYQRIGTLDKAIAAYRKALEIDPDYPEAHTNLASIYKE